MYDDGALQITSKRIRVKIAVFYDKRESCVVDCLTLINLESPEELEWRFVHKKKHMSIVFQEGKRNFFKAAFIDELLLSQSK